MLLAAFCVAALARGEVAHMQVLHDDAQFKAALNCNDGKLLAIDFTASWCGPCKMIGPRFGAFAESGNFPFVRFAKVDVDENSDAAAACGVRAMPTFQFYRHGTKVDEFTGADENRLLALLHQLGGPPVDFAPKANVLTYGLQSRPQLNAQKGVIAGLDTKTGRYQVKLGEETLALKRQNLIKPIRVTLRPPQNDELPTSAKGCTHATLNSFDSDACSYKVLLDSGELLDMPASCVQLPDGECGVVCGLQGAAEHNGKCGYLLSFDEGADRYEVALDNKNRLRLKRANFHA